MSEWRTFEGYVDYEVDVMGNVRRKADKRPMKPYLSKIGYFVVHLTKNKVSKPAYIHRAVAHAFLPKVDGKDQVNHKDGNKTNNGISNLEWVTKGENHAHAHRVGLCKSPSLKLTVNEVKEIKEHLKHYRKGMIARLGKLYGVTPEAISAIRTGKNWKYV